MRRLCLAIGLLASAAAALACGRAAAQSCLALQSELASLQEQSTGGGDPERYERAFRKQADVLARTESRARDAGCFGGGFFFFRQDPDRSCRELLPKLRDMQDNLDRLDVMRRRRGGDRFGRRIRAIKGMMAVRGCGLNGAEALGQPEPPEWGFDQGQQFSSRGTYRTLCVRMCDGYYFPISFSTTQQQFGEDAQTCSAMCPGADAKLFTHANPGGSPEDMVGIDGQPYASLPTAFQYRTTISQSCTCKAAGGTTAASANPGGLNLAAPVEDRTAPIPQPRPEPGEDPETLANRAGKLSPETAPIASETQAANDATTGGKPVRIVGPVFGASPEQAGVVLTPVPN